MSFPTKCVLQIAKHAYKHHKVTQYKFRTTAKYGAKIKKKLAAAIIFSKKPKSIILKIRSNYLSKKYPIKI